MIRLHLLLASSLLVSGVWCDESLKEKFTTSLLKELSTSGENVVISPVSLQSAMGIVGFGAKGQTEKEVWTTLGLNPESAKSVLTDKQKKLSERTAPGAVWKIANRIMAAPDLPVKKEYLTEVNNAFPGTAVDNFDFESPQKTADNVNGWVSENTKGVINKLLDPSSINPNSKLIVLNAVYFKGEWKNGFDKKRTKKECFYSTPGKCTMTDMMHIKEDFKYGYHNDMKAQIIEFPYKNEDFSMIVVLPDEKHGDLKKLISNLNVDDIVKFIDEKKWTVEVHVTMPKFEIEFEKQMKDPLMKMGMKNIFTDASDLSGMITGLRANVDSVVHKAKITCDEEGTVAAAATGFGHHLIKPSPPKLLTYFTADRPFIYILRNQNTGVLFAGTVNSF